MQYEWLTHFEKSGGISTPNYENSMEYFAQIAEFSPHAKMGSFGTSAQGRPLPFLIIGKGKSFTPHGARRKNKAIVMVQNVIHGGEVEGKDAWMLLLREILVTGELQHLLDQLVLVVIPILNVDGHERIGASNRPNQNGPLQMGWRTTAQNLDLNRDYVKADSPEMKALLRMFHQWMPDFYIDNHCTNGADFQYHVLYSIESHQNIHPLLAQWNTAELLPFVRKQLNDQGFLTGPYNESNDLNGGIINTPALPRLSTGYSAMQNRLCLLVEAHSLKPYENRVLSTKAMNQAALTFIGERCMELKEINSQVDIDTIQEFHDRKQPFPLVVSLQREPEPISFKGIDSVQEYSPITASLVTRYTGKPVDMEIPFYNKARITETVIVPEAYVIPVEYSHIADHLRLHGVEVLKLRSNFFIAVEKYRFRNVSFASWPYESRQRPSFDMEVFQQEMEIPEGAWIIPTRQRALRLILQLLEPLGTDSLVRWGFFNPIFERKEYAEPFIMEPFAQQMIEEDTQLRNEFYQRLADDPEFRQNPSARLDFFYERSVFFDRNEKVYPVLRILDRAILENTRPA